MKSNIKKNFLYQSAYQMLMIISPLITSPYVSRMLGAENLGVYSYGYSMAYYFGIFAVLGVSNYGNRAIAKVKESDLASRNKLFSEIFVMQAITSIFVVACYLLYVYLFAKNYTINAFIELLYVLSVCLDVSWLFFGIEEFKITTIRSFLIRLVTIISIFLFVNRPDDLNTYTFIMAGGNLLASVLLLFYLHKYIKFTYIKFTDVIKHFKPNVVLFIPVVSLALFHYMDKVMLGSYSTMEELGYYTNADKVINIPMGLITGLGTVMLPRISSLSSDKDWKAINNYIANSIILSMWISSAMCFGIMAVVREFVPLFFGPGFEKCADLLLILSPIILIKAWSHVFRMQFLIPLGKDKEFNISVIIAAVINVIFNMAFIPKMGAVGAVIGTIIAESCVAFLYTWYAREEVHIKASIILSILFILSGAIMYIIITAIGSILTIDSYFIALSIKIITGGIVYTTITGIFMILLKYEPMVKLFYLILIKVSNFSHKFPQ